MIKPISFEQRRINKRVQELSKKNLGAISALEIIVGELEERARRLKKQEASQNDKGSTIWSDQCQDNDHR
jgi:hypothetical protein